MELASTLQRLQVCSGLDWGTGPTRWLDILGLGQKKYQSVLQRQSDLPDSSLISLAQFLEIQPEEILAGAVDFRKISVSKGNGQRTLPKSYSIAAFGRRRTTITSFDYLEDRAGWRVRADVLRAFHLNEAILSDYMAPINMQFMTDVADYLHSRHGLRHTDFFQMGAHSPLGNRNTLIGRTLSAARSPAEAYEMLFDGLIKFFEQNTKYTITELDEMGCTIEVTSYRYVAEALGVRQLGSHHICGLKAGFLASIPFYLNQKLAAVTETSCVHSGDSVCRFEVEFPISTQAAFAKGSTVAS